MDLWPKYYHGPRQSITVLQRNRLNLSRAGEHISKHRTLRGAILAAQQDADDRDTEGTYRIRVGGGLLMEFEIVPRADVTIRFSQGTPINAYPTGATISGDASAPSASQIGAGTEVTINGVAITGQAAAPAVGEFALLTIPDITVGVGQTHDMSQYILDPLGELVSTSIINLNAAYATYDDTTLLLTGVQETPTPQTNVQLEVTYGAQAFDYVGIPYPTTANATIAARGFEPWVNYDPFTEPTPSWESGDIYVNPQTGSDTSNPTGSPGSPRATVPTATQSAGTKIFLAGTHGDIVLTGDLPGTDANPCWIIGVAGNSVDTLAIGNNSHLIVDGLDMSGYDTNAIDMSPSTESHHITIRNCDITDRRWVSNNSCISGNPASGVSINHIIIYNCDFSDAGYKLPNGDLTDWSTDKDFHGVTPGIFGRDVRDGCESMFWWIIDCTGNRISGNLVQVAGQNFTLDTPADIYAASHDFYIAGNVGTGSRQALVWTKQAGYVVFSENRSHDFVTFPTQSATCFGYQYSPHKVYWLNNEAYNADYGIRSAGDQGQYQDDDSEQYFLNNIIYNIKDNTAAKGGGIQPYGTALALWGANKATIWNNTLYDNRLAIGFAQSIHEVGITSGLNTASIVNNVCHTVRNNADDPTGDASYGHIDCANFDPDNTTIEFENNSFYDDGGLRVQYKSSTYTSATTLNALTEATSNKESDPTLINPTITYGANNFRPNTGSPCINAGVATSINFSDDPYATFLADFGISCETDFYGGTRKVSTIDIGAAEVQ